MGEPKDKICRLCLSFKDISFTKLDASAIGKVKAIVPELALSFPNDAFVCSKCRDMLEKSFELKRTFSKNNDLIQNEKDKSGCNKVDLNIIIKVGNSKPCENICRICLKPIEGKYVYINEKGDDDFKNVLDFCVPELDETLTQKPAVCSSCQILLYEMYNYKKDWLSVEEKIRSSIDCVTDEGIDLHKVLNLNGAEDENDFLSGFEVKDEDETDIFDEIPTTVEEKHLGAKRSISEIEREIDMSQIKRQKLMRENISDEELPHFNFTADLIYNPNKSDAMVEDWLGQVEEYKEKFKWSDYTTIHKVLVKLKDMKEMYIWFSNIADIMDWKQWKTKLVRAFPRRSDYFMHVKKMMVRRKKKDETYVTYYNDKLKLMEPLNLTAEQKISCIFGGIMDILVCCVGRVGNYKGPEELLDYFKSCDDKESVEAAAEINKFVPKPQKKVKAKAQNKAPQKLTAKEKKNAVTKCSDCHRYGHTVNECRRYKIAEHLDRVDKIKPQNNPSMKESKAKRTRKTKASKNCFICGKSGHLASSCKLNSNPSNKDRNTQQQKLSPKKPKELSDIRCSNCHKKGHPASICWSKKADKHGNVSSPRNQQPSKSTNDTYYRCQNCGKFTNKSNPCCTASSEKYIGAYSSPYDVYNKQICLRCYKTGHLTNDCEEFSRKLYRK